MGHSPDGRPDTRRRRAGKGWHYAGPDSAPVRDAATLARSPAIPPAYTDVWINPDPRGHLQAWPAERDETKFGRLAAFGQALPTVREQPGPTSPGPG